MTRALMVGGPLHGQMRTFRDHPPMQWLVPRPPTPVPIADLASWSPATLNTPDPYQYKLCWYDGDETYPPTGRQTRLPAYHCADKPCPTRQRGDEQEAFQEFVANGLWLAAYEQTLPNCVVPSCTDKARETFIAAERGRLAGREWDYDDEIKVCPRHGYDIRRATIARGIDQLPEWLQPDATWDPLDLYDGSADQLYGAEILTRTARMLRISYPTPTRRTP